MTIRKLTIATATAALAVIATPALAQEAVPDAPGAGQAAGQPAGQAADQVPDWAPPPQAPHGMHGQMDHGAMPHAPMSDGAMPHPPMHAGAPYARGDYDSQWDGEWSGEWVSPDRYEGSWEGSWEAGHHGPHGDAGRPYAPGLGYSREMRDAWLDQCRATYYHTAYSQSSHRGPDGAVVGGLFGALAGGFIGNRVARGERLGGTLLGAGAGALAGAAVGDALDGDAARGAEDAYDACEAYLRQYEASAMYWAHHSYYGYGPVYWVKVPIHRTRRAVCRCETTGEVTEEVVEEEIIEEEVIEEVVEEKVVARPQAPRPAPVKTTKLQPVK